MNGQAMGSQAVARTVALAGAGDETAFAQLVAAYHADMARVAFVACGDRELAEDAVQLPARRQPAGLERPGP